MLGTISLPLAKKLDLFLQEKATAVEKILGESFGISPSAPTMIITTPTSYSEPMTDFIDLEVILKIQELLIVAPSEFEKCAKGLPEMIRHVAFIQCLKKILLNYTDGDRHCWGYHSRMHTDNATQLNKVITLSCKLISNDLDLQEVTSCLAIALDQVFEEARKTEGILSFNLAILFYALDSSRLTAKTLASKVTFIAHVGSFAETLGIVALTPLSMMATWPGDNPFL